MKLLELKKKAPSNTFAMNNLASGSFADHLAVLGLFKVIHEQLDSRVRGFWKNNTFHLQTDKTKEDILNFFCNQYQPLPLFCVWDNNFSKTEKLISQIEDSRFSSSLETLKELLSIRHQFDPAYSSTKVNKVETGKKKNGDPMTESITSKKLFLAHLFRQYPEQRFLDILCALAIPYEYNGVEQVQYTKLGNGAAGFMPNQKTIDYPYWSALLSSERKHYESTLFSVPHSDVLIPDVNLGHIDIFGNWSEQQQFGIGHVSSKPDTIDWLNGKVSWGSDPVLTILMIEGMTFFRGRVATNGAYSNQLKGVDFDEVNTKENYVKTIPFCVKNNSVSFSTGSWGEQQSSMGGIYEIWAPQWEESLSYRSLLSEIRSFSEVVQQTKVTLNDATDMMLFLSQQGKNNGVTIFHRYLMPSRQGKGSSVVVSLEKFDCRRDIRVDVITSILPALKDIRRVIENENINSPNTVQKTYELTFNEVSKFISGQSSVLDVSLKFVDLIQHLRRSKVTRSGGSVEVYRRYYPTQLHSSGNEVIRHGKPILNTSSERFMFNEKWISSIISESNTSEVRLALSIATKTPYSTLEDVSEFLDGSMDTNRMDKLVMFFEMCRIPHNIEFGVTRGKTPWVPMDYALGVLLHQSVSDDTNRDSSDVRSWKNLLSFNRNDDAMETAIHRLRMRGVLRRNISIFTSTNPTLLYRSVDIPLCSNDIKRLIQFVN